MSESSSVVVGGGSSEPRRLTRMVKIRVVGGSVKGVTSVRVEDFEFKVHHRTGKRYIFYSLLPRSNGSPISGVTLR